MARVEFSCVGIDEVVLQDDIVPDSDKVNSIPNITFDTIAVVSEQVRLAENRGRLP
jgi:hypothetical protein